MGNIFGASRGPTCAGDRMTQRLDHFVSTSWLRGLHVAVLVAVSLVVTYYGVVYRGQLPDHRWLMGWNDTFLHVCSFGLLTLLVLPLFRDWRGPVAVLAAFAVAIEAIQLAIPVRTASFGDLAASLTGIALGAAFLTAVRVFVRRLTAAFEG
jgi:VanZ family protein